MNPAPQPLFSLHLKVLKDLRVSQTSASSTADRLKMDKGVIVEILTDLIMTGHAETHIIADTITVYRITPKGLETIS
jgi:hypothetical protein